MRLDHLLKTTASRHPNKIACVRGETRRTFGQIDQLSDHFAGTLGALGVRRGDRVVVFMENGPEAVVALFGALKAGAVVCPLDPTLSPADLTFVLNDARALLVVTDSALAPTTAMAMMLAPSVRLVAVSGDFDPTTIRGSFSFEDAIAPGAPAVREIAGSDFDAALALYTTDRTGFPTAEPVSHRNAVSRAIEAAGYFIDGENEIVLCVLPFSFEHALYQVLAAAQIGATIVLEGSSALPDLFRKPAKTLGLSASALHGAPSAFRRISMR